MKKRFEFITDRNGFILPYVLFTTALVIIIVTASIQLYKNELQITERQTEQLKIETLFQMGRAQFIESLQDHNLPESPVTYHFPYGDVAIQYKILDTNEHHLYFTITTNRQSVISLPHQLAADPE
ncbi:hypothetical protein GCM10009001_19320 [Virgibacillus siamensis]|uniref:ComG operon protein 7 n=1 Tax=Virgibacillus siamensis TaxID=480071 RepID=A0ABN1G1V4_9BACI